MKRDCRPEGPGNKKLMLLISRLLLRAGGNNMAKGGQHWQVQGNEWSGPKICLCYVENVLHK